MDGGQVYKPAEATYGTTHSGVPQGDCLVPPFSLSAPYRSASPDSRVVLVLIYYLRATVNVENYEEIAKDVYSD